MQSTLHSLVELNLSSKLIIGALCICLFTSCGDLFPSGKDDPLVVDAEILRIDVEPNPVQVGDTVTFICVLEDSLADDLRFKWHTPNNQRTVTTKVNQYSFEVELGEGEYFGSVSVDDTLQDGITPNKSFNFQVIE